MRQEIRNKEESGHSGWLPSDNHTRARGGGPVRVHRRDLQADDATMVDGLPVTTVTRTIEDCHELGTDPVQLHLAIR